MQREKRLSEWFSNHFEAAKFVRETKEKFIEPIYKIRYASILPTPNCGYLVTIDIERRL